MSIDETTTTAAPAADSDPSAEHESLRGVISSLLADLREGRGDRDKRRQVEEWMKSLAEKYPEFDVAKGLRDYYLAEAERMRAEFEKASDLTEKLNLGRSIENFLDKATDYGKKAGGR
jgi:hypothetical protein